ncbi:hypothetical protein ATO6_04315 [Oceanicola sp. 22II-s10i]|uniref:HNH endonuclease n=1 Tax=Oceanicola sp. 22II-s10i TaxID=1317116 RepID=UPI000B5275E7|nr:HNH endonuclease [Oceanicola sp. 22II-s10i]OWU86091.1 hypothetical protein ATO6_04315 [Oceanicola sp. 22II-s10i]
MGHAVFIQNPVSIYADAPGEVYNFPKIYLSRVKETVGDWVVLYESRKGAFGYVGVQKVIGIEPDPVRFDHYYAVIEPGSLMDFEHIVPRETPFGIAYEKSLRGADGRATSGGQNVSAVRLLSDPEFAAIVDAGLAAIAGPDAMPRTDRPGLEEAQTDYSVAPLSGDRRRILASRSYRDQSFERKAKAAYGGRCAISGLSLRNGGGRPEVQAAHIRPVKNNGPDTINNGIALSGTLHWMFDRGLISVAEDMTILVSHNKVDPETARRLIHPGQKLMAPPNLRHHPHPDYLRFHREQVFGRVA